MPKMRFCSLMAADLGRWTMPEMGCRGVISGRETIGGRGSSLSYRTRGAELAGRLPSTGPALREFAPSEYGAGVPQLH